MTEVQETTILTLQKSYGSFDRSPKNSLLVKIQSLRLLKKQLKNLEEGNDQVENLRGRIKILKGSIRIEKLREENLQRI